MEHGVIGLTRRIRQRCLDVIRFQIGEVLENHLVRNAVGQHPEDVGHANAQAADARTPAAFARLDCDAFEKFHGGKLP